MFSATIKSGTGCGKHGYFLIMQAAKKKTRLTREAWLQQALETLAEDPEHLRIDELAERLGVSKGSFYWHFENRSEFITAMAEYWRDTYTSAVADEILEDNPSPEDRLRAILEEVLIGKVARYDLAVRAWARHEPSIRPVIHQVDEIRLRTLRDLFLELGLDQTEAKTRARVFVACHSFEDALSIQLNRQEARRQIETRLAFFTRR